VRNDDPAMAEIIGQPAFEIVRVEMPLQDELPVLYQTQDGLRPPFCLGQCRHKIADRMAMMAITTNSSIRVNLLSACSLASAEGRETGKIIIN